MNTLIQFKLKVLKDFQEKYPTSHVGGSIGLMLRGVDLKRDLSSSDLDITIDEFVPPKEDKSISDRSDNNDFDFNLKKEVDNGYYVKMDIRVNPEPSFDVISFNGQNYNVSKLRDIIFWKTKYSQKNIIKHKNDLIVIQTGIRPPEPVTSSIDVDLTF